MRIFIIVWFLLCSPLLLAEEQVVNAVKAEVTNEQQIDELNRYFFAAARTGEIAVLQTFLAAGYPVNEPNAQSYTALMVAAYAGQAEVVNLLLNAGANACIRDKRGHTALMGAMIKAEWSIARTLYVVDCDKNNTAKATDVVTDKQQMTAAQFAGIFGQTGQFRALAEPATAAQSITAVQPMNAVQPITATR